MAEARSRPCAACCRPKRRSHRTPGLRGLPQPLLPLAPAHSSARPRARWATRCPLRSARSSPPRAPGHRDSGRRRFHDDDERGAHRSAARARRPGVRGLRQRRLRHDQERSGPEVPGPEHRHRADERGSNAGSVWPRRPGRPGQH